MTPAEAERYLDRVRNVLVLRSVNRELDRDAKGFLVWRLDRVRALLRSGRLTPEYAGYAGDDVLAAARLLPPLVSYQTQAES